MNEPWFRHNQRGFGPGLPVHRNGWIVLGLYVAALLFFPVPLAAFLGYDPHSYQRLAAILAVSIPFGVITWRTTEGGWGSRKDEEEDDGGSA